MRLPTATALLAAAFTASAAPPAATLSPAAKPAPAEPGLAELRSAGVPGQAIAVRTQLLAATVKSVDAASRTVNVQWKDGQTQAIKAGPEVKRFDQIAAGDEVLVDVRQELRLEVQAPGSASVPFTVAAAGGRTALAGAPGAVVSAGIQATVTVTAIAAATRKVTFQDPAGATYDVLAGKDLALEKLKVGDRLLATYTEATVVRLEKAAK